MYLTNRYKFSEVESNTGMTKHCVTTLAENSGHAPGPTLDFTSFHSVPARCGRHWWANQSEWPSLSTKVVFMYILAENFQRSIKRI